MAGPVSDGATKPSLPILRRRNGRQRRHPLTAATLVVALAGCLLAAATAPCSAAVGDPQLRTNHPWYPGELACSTFPRLFAEQARVYQQVTGEKPATDEQKALASWLWRNTHYYHGEPGGEDLWGQGFQADGAATRDYWTGLFAHGFALCGTTHAQWIAEMQALFGHNRARCAGVEGHNSFEVLLRGGAYGEGRWALLDHDISTVVFDEKGERLLSMAEIVSLGREWTRPEHLPEKQHGWRVCGLHPEDGAVFTRYHTAEYLAGYSGPPPMVHLRRGESLRRYHQPGLEDGRTFVFWGRNYGVGGVPGPERSRTWVNQPEAMHQASGDAGHRDGQARYANAVFTYRPDFATADYREGVVDESASHVTFEFLSPYVIGATPAGDDGWSIYQPGGRNGLVVTAKGKHRASVSTDFGRTWTEPRLVDGSLDWTDAVKGRRQYWLRLHSGAGALRDAQLAIVTVCQANAAVLPRLTDGESRIEYQATGQAIVSAGPEASLAKARLTSGGFDTPQATITLQTPGKQRAVAVYAVAHWRSSNPPSPDVRYTIEHSLDGGRTWRSIVDDWRITRYPDEPADFWSQSFCWGNAELDGDAHAVQVRFRNDGGKQLSRAEAHLAYRVAQQDDAVVEFAWSDDAGEHRASRRFAPGDSTWRLATGKNVRTRWVEFRPAPAAVR